jgi:competence protein ComEC
LETSQNDERTGRTVPFLTLLLPLCAFVLVWVVVGQLPDGRLHMWVLDVGQGDAIVVRTPGGRTALVDGGPGASKVLEGLGKSTPFWQRHIDMVVLTHPHDDHMLGLVEAGERYGISLAVQTAFTSTLREGARAEWLALLERKGVPVYHPRRGDRIRISGEPDVSFLVLSPGSPEARFEWQGGDLNNTSVVLRLDYGSHRFLLTGDAQAEAEASMAAALPSELASSVLKVGHHGSDTSSTSRFLSLVRPRVAVISSGRDNRYGHPSPQTLDALATMGAQVYRTDQHGTVEFIADRERLWVRSER